MPIQQAIRDLALDYSNRLLAAIDLRTKEMLADDVSHYLIYRVLGISHSEGQQIDLYQNKGRFLYKYAGSFLEQATKNVLSTHFQTQEILEFQTPEVKDQKHLKLIAWWEMMLWK
jgi:hypothetical protein